MQEVQAIFSIFMFVCFTWIPVLCLIMPTFYRYSIDLVKEFFFARFLFFSHMCKLNIFTFHSIYKFFIIQLENGRKSIVQMMQNHLVSFAFCRCLYACLIILLHSRWTHVSQVSHWILWWFLATGRLQILQGNFITIFLNAKTK